MNLDRRVTPMNFLSRRWRNLPFLLVGFAVLSCCDDCPTTSQELVTVSGIVNNIDALPNASVPNAAKGVRVSQFGTGFSDIVATGDDGRFAIQVPKGTQLLLMTDDFDDTNDEWFPLINADYPGMYASEDMENLIIHACPQTSGMEPGSVAAWDNFLANWDDNHGDQFAPTSAAESGGIISFVLTHSEVDTSTNMRRCGPKAGVQISLNSDAFPVCYADPTKFGTPGIGPDPNAGPDICYPPGKQSSGPGPVFSFGAPSSSSTRVLATFADTIASRGIQFKSPYPIPVQPGTITLLFVGSVDSDGERHFTEVLSTCSSP